MLQGLGLSGDTVTNEPDPYSRSLWSRSHHLRQIQKSSFLRKTGAILCTVEFPSGPVFFVVPVLDGQGAGAEVSFLRCAVRRLLQARELNFGE